MSGFRSVGRNGLQSADFRIPPQNDDESSVISSQFSGEASASSGAGRNSPAPQTESGRSRSPRESWASASCGGSRTIPISNSSRWRRANAPLAKRIARACVWHLDGEEYAGRGNMIVQACTPEAVSADIVFSALDNEPARHIEPAFRPGRSLRLLERGRLQDGS